MENILIYSIYSHILVMATNKFYWYFSWVQITKQNCTSKYCRALPFKLVKIMSFFSMLCQSAIKWEVFNFIWTKIEIFWSLMNSVCIKLHTIEMKFVMRVTVIFNFTLIHSRVNWKRIFNVAIIVLNTQI